MPPRGMSTPRNTRAARRNGKLGGRPPKPVDGLQVIKLASEGLTQEEVAASLDVSSHVISSRFRDQYKKGCQLRTASLRRKQTKRALAGSDTMLIWLGKQDLGQADKVDVDAKLRGAFIETHKRLEELTDEQLDQLEALLEGPKVVKAAPIAPGVPALPPGEPEK